METPQMTRAEHLQWCKDRALEYVEAGLLDQAMASFCSDWRKHDDMGSMPTVLIQLGTMYAMSGNAEDMRRWITGFN
jgi:hypothetical protein